MSTEFLWDDGGDVVDRIAEAKPRADSHIPGLPAETGLWVFVIGDMTVFGWFFLVYMWEDRHDRAGFATSASALYQPIGVANTLVLLASSLFVVLALHAHRAGQIRHTGWLLVGAGACAATFVALKAVEYTLEISAGHTPAEGTFFVLYFALTGIHLIHVLIGAGLLFAWWRAARRRRGWPRDRMFAESAAVYWHMVDLLWIVIFTLVYLVSTS